MDSGVCRVLDSLLHAENDDEDVFQLRTDTATCVFYIRCISYANLTLLLLRQPKTHSEHSLAIAVIPSTSIAPYSSSARHVVVSDLPQRLVLYSCTQYSGQLSLPSQLSYAKPQTRRHGLPTQQYWDVWRGVRAMFM